MANISHLSTEVKQRLLEFLKIDPKYQETALSVIERSLNESYIPLKPVKMDSDLREVDFKNDQRDDLNSTVKSLKKISQLIGKINNEISRLDSRPDIVNILSEHIAFRLVNSQPLPTPEQHIPVPPQTILNALSKSCDFVAQDHKQAYSKKWNKLLSDLTDIWEFTLKKGEPKIHEDSEFIIFLSIITGEDNSSLKKAYIRYKQSR